MERGIAAHEAGRPGEALECYRAALALDPDDAEANSLYGLALVHLGRAAEAGPALRKAVAAEPGEIGFRANLVEFLEATEQFAEALEEASRITAQSPNFARGWEKSGDLALRLGRPGDAAGAFARAFGLQPDNFALVLKLARVRISLRDFPAAKQALDRAARLRPGDRQLPPLYAALFTATRDWRTLEAAARAWTRAAPDDAAAWRSLATAAFEQGRHAEAVETFSRVLEIGPRDAENLSIYGRLCLHALQFDTAQAALNEAERLDPDHAATLAAKGLLLAYRGRFAEAEECCNRSIARDPEHVPVYTLLSRLKRGRLADEQMATLSRLAEDEARHLEVRIAAAFALAHGLDVTGDAGPAFAAYERANALAAALGRAEGLTYDPAAAEARCRRLIEAFPAAPAGPAPGPERPRPVFIVGMPRSGTTLVEAMLSAHSRVFACGERPMMPQILDAWLHHLERTGAPPPPGMQRRWVETWLRELPALGAADHVTDKLPLNFEAAGVIGHLFPDAVIVNIRRNPLETGLSIFRHEFSRFWSFAHRLQDIGHACGQYARLTGHWEQVLGPRFITVQYEDLASGFADAAPELVRACGLDWEAACGAFQQTKQPIATFSTVQAREPVSSRNGRVDRYRDFLAPLSQALAAAGVDLDTGAPLAVL